MQPIRVCVADDDVDEAYVLCDGLRLHGYEAVPAHSGLAALELCKGGQIDLVLLDIRMPDINGYDVCKQLKADAATRDIPVIFVTAKGDAEGVREGYDAGAVDYIPKPFNLPMVMVRVDSAVRTPQQPDMPPMGPSVLLDTSYTDALTGLRNRRYIVERLQEEVDKAQRFKYPVSCVVLDVDDVHPLDSEWGSANDDDLLAEIAFAMRNSSRNFDILARYDGTVFAAVLPHAPLQNAVAYAQKIQKQIDGATFGDPPTRAQLAFGVVCCNSGNSHCADRLISEAMRALFNAKSHARERICAREITAEKVGPQESPIEVRPS